MKTFKQFFEDAQLDMRQSREKMRVKNQHRRELEQLKRRHDAQAAASKRQKEREKQQ